MTTRILAVLTCIALNIPRSFGCLYTSRSVTERQPRNRERERATRSSLPATIEGMTVQGQVTETGSNRLDRGGKIPIKFLRSKQRIVSRNLFVEYYYRRCLISSDIARPALSTPLSGVIKVLIDAVRLAVVFGHFGVARVTVLPFPTPRTAT